MALQADAAARQAAARPAIDRTLSTRGRFPHRSSWKRKMLRGIKQRLAA